MKTDDLITALAADATPAGPAPGTMLWVTVAAGTIATALVFAGTLGVRPDIESALGTGRFLFKFVVALAAALPALVLALRLMRPQTAVAQSGWLLALGPAVLGLGVLFELVALRPAEWLPNAMGRNALLCLTAIPLLAVAPCVALFVALRRGAPANPRAAGAICGVAAAAIGAFFYASHCTDDSPLFVAVWYSLAILFVSFVAGLAGVRWLRW